MQSIYKFSYKVLFHFFLGTKSSKSGVYFPLVAHLQFRPAISEVFSNYRIGPHNCKY